MARPKVMARPAMMSELRAPSMARLNRSNPFLSVPIRPARSGLPFTGLGASANQAHFGGNWLMRRSPLTAVLHSFSLGAHE